MVMHRLYKRGGSATTESTPYAHTRTHRQETRQNPQHRKTHHITLGTHQNHPPKQEEMSPSSLLLDTNTNTNTNTDNTTTNSSMNNDNKKKKKKNKNNNNNNNNATSAKSTNPGSNLDDNYNYNSKLSSNPSPNNNKNVELRILRAYNTALFRGCLQRSCRRQQKTC